MIQIHTQILSISLHYSTIQMKLGYKYVTIVRNLLTKLSKFCKIGLILKHKVN